MWRGDGGEVAGMEGSRVVRYRGGVGSEVVGCLGGETGGGTD